MEDNVKKLIEEKATEVSQILHSAGYMHIYRLIDYGINFMLQYEGGNQTLTLSYSPKKRRWTPHSGNEWIKDVVIPLIQPLFDRTQSTTPEQVVSPISIEHPSNIGVHHFAEARECLRLLEPFANDNIDFSIICDFARRGIHLILEDPNYAKLDRTMLQGLLSQPSQSDFYAVKEYLSQCLTRCNLPTGN